MKKAILMIMAACLAVTVLAACGGGTSSSQPQSQPASSSVASQPESVSQPAGSAPESTPQPNEGADLQGMLDAMVEAAGLGGTVAIEARDLKFGGVNEENLVQVAGAQAQTAAENGGIAVVILAQPGMAEVVKADMETFRDNSMGNEDYAEFEAARTNTGQARIVVNGDYVVYAVSATGDWDALDAAIAGLFA